MKKTITIILISLSITTLSFSKKLFVLYGFKLGQKIHCVKSQFGKPVKVHKFKDGFKSYVYKFKNHYVVFTSDNRRPDIIWGIQLTGKNNKKHYGFKNINLGDHVKKLIKTFDRPSLKRTAIDEISKKKLKKIVYYSYYKNGNYSFEIKNNYISSIKLNFMGPEITSEKLTAIEFINFIKKRNFYSLCSNISIDFKIFRSNKIYKIKKSILKTLLYENIFKHVFFNKKTGLVSLSKKDIKTVNLRFQDDGTTGLVYKFFKNNLKFELFFSKSYEGTVLKYIYIN